MLSLSSHYKVAVLALGLGLSGCHRSLLRETNTIHYGGGTIAVNRPDYKPQFTRADLHDVAGSIWLTMSASKEIQVKTRAKIITANGAQPNKGGLELHVFLTDTTMSVSDQPYMPAHLIISVPLSSTGGAYGESRSCFLAGPQGVQRYRYTTGLDEDNFVPFAPMSSEREFKFSLNKYLCRALAAPYSCQDAHGAATRENTPADMSNWKIDNAEIEISSSTSPARADVSSITLTSTGKPFDYATCAKIAPSDGMCCVAHKQTEWHCGTKPEGDGWHQVSDSCYHRETGASCTD